MRLWWGKKERPPQEPRILELRWASARQGADLPGPGLETLTLNPSYDEYWDRFPSAAIAVASKLFAGMQVLTSVQAPPPYARATRKQPLYSGQQMFLRTYFETLDAHGQAGNIQYQKPEELIAQTAGADTPLATLLFPGDYGVFLYRAYGYASLPPMETFQQMKEQIRNGPYMVYLDYGRAPDEVELTIDRNAFPLACCVSRIRAACQAFDIPLEIDPKLSPYVQSF